MPVRDARVFERLDGPVSDDSMGDYRIRYKILFRGIWLYQHMGVLFGGVGVLITRALLFGVCIPLVFGNSHSSGP